MEKFVHNKIEIDYELGEEMINGKRFYITPDGKKYPSITTVLSSLSKESIAKWRQRVGEDEANRISQRATTRGTKIHSICEDYLNNKDDYVSNVDYGLIEQFNSIKPILDENVSEIIALEVPLYSHHLQLAGRVDCICKFNNKKTILDFKTSRKQKKIEWIKSYFMQCAGYAVMWEERTGIPITQLAILIAVENESPQLFIQHRDDWIGDLIDLRLNYK